MYIYIHIFIDTYIKPSKHSNMRPQNTPNRFWKYSWMPFASHVAKHPNLIFSNKYEAKCSFCLPRPPMLASKSIHKSFSVKTPS